MDSHIDTVCSPEGIRTPHLFLESDEVEKSGPDVDPRTNEGHGHPYVRVRKAPSEIENR